MAKRKKVDDVQQQKLDIALEWFKSKDITYTDISEEVDISTSTISQAYSQNSGGPPSITTYNAIIEFYEEKAEELEGRTLERVDTVPLKFIRCPFDLAPMQLIRVKDKLGFTTFKCPECLSAIEVMPNFSSLLMREFPTRLRKIVEEFNETQRKDYDKLIEKYIGEE